MQELKEILQEINSSSDLSVENVVEKIKDELQQKLPDIYSEWESNQFDINHPLIQDHIFSIAIRDSYAKLLELCKKGAETLLCIAAKHGYTKIVENLLENGAKTDVKTGYCKRAPLHSAAQYGHIQVVEVLLKKGAKVDLQDGKG